MVRQLAGRLGLRARVARRTRTWPLGMTLALMVAVIAVAGCESRGLGEAAPLTRDFMATVRSGGRERSYLVHLPPVYLPGRRLPVVLAFHGGGGTASGMAALTRFNTVADENGFIVVYPQGIALHWADGRRTTAPDRAGVDDVAFVSDLIDALARTLTIDTTRVYAAGLSNGGFFVTRLGCQLAGKIAAIGVVAATMPTLIAERCAPGQPVPVVLIHGTHDPVVPAAGGLMKLGAGGEILSLGATARLWARLNGCVAVPQTQALPAQVDDGTHVTRVTYTPCQDGARVVTYSIAGGGHTWPGGRQYLPPRVIGRTTPNMNASRVLWTFFQGYRLPSGGCEPR